MVIAGIIYGTQRRKDAKKNIISHRLHRFSLMKRFTQITKISFNL